MRGATVQLAPMEQAGSQDFAEGESELKVTGLTSTGHGSAVCADETEWANASSVYRELLSAKASEPPAGR